MALKEIKKPFMVKKRDAFLNSAFDLFSKRDIESVSMLDVAKASGHGPATLYRYFSSKPQLVVAVATWKWQQMEGAFTVNVDWDKMTAARLYEEILDSFLRLYRDHSDLLRFNQFFNIYIQSERVSGELLQPYQDMIAEYAKRFHGVYLKAQEDHTLRTDVTEQEIFSTSLHLMLAVITRYAVGLVYHVEHEYDADKEITTLRDLLLQNYITDAAVTGK